MSTDKSEEYFEKIESFFGKSNLNSNQEKNDNSNDQQSIKMNGKSKMFYLKMKDGYYLYLAPIWCFCSWNSKIPKPWLKQTSYQRD